MTLDLAGTQAQYEGAVFFTECEVLTSRMTAIGIDCRHFNGVGLGAVAAELLAECAAANDKELPLCILVPTWRKRFGDIVERTAPEFVWLQYPHTSEEALRHVRDFRNLPVTQKSMESILKDRERVLIHSYESQVLRDPGEIHVRPPRSKALQIDWGTPIPREWLEEQGPNPDWLIRFPDWLGSKCDPGMGDGMIRRGKVGILTAAGGVGKTAILLDLAISVITKRKWLGYFEPERDGREPRVLALLAEEDADELRRRLYHWTQQFNLTDQEADLLSRSLHVKGLAGEDVALAQRPDKYGEIEDTQMFRDLLDSVRSQAIDLIVVDPLSRFAAGLGIDADNSAATRVIAGLERLAGETGATVLVASHSSKASRRDGTADVRGATSLSDSARWVATLVDCGDGHVAFQQVKSNYSRPMPKAIILQRDDRGRLSALSSDEQRAYEHEKEEQSKAEKEAQQLERATEHAHELVQQLRLRGVAATRKELFSRLSGVGTDKARRALSHAMKEGWVIEKEDGLHAGEDSPII
jgi:RecA-family ATPase